MEWTIYWITRADAIRNAFGGLIGITGVVSMVLAIVALEFSISKKSPPPKKQLITSVLVFLFCVVVTVLTPSKQDLMLIYGVPALMKSQAGAIKQAEVLPEKLLKVLNAEADKLLEKETTEK